MEKPRYHHFDFLRAIAILLGIPLHACLAYGTIDYHWLLKDPSHSYAIDIMLDFLRLFRMPLFFVISGFFSNLVINKGQFLSKRTRRLLVPLLVFFPLFIMPLKFLWLAMEVPDKLFALDLSFLYLYIKENLMLGSTAEHVRYPPNWGHLWFLMYLYLFSIVSIPLSKVKLINFKKFPILVLTGMILSFLSYFLMKTHWVDRPFVFWPLLSLVAYYGVFYLFGWQLFHFKDLGLGKRNSILLLAVGSICAVVRSYLEVNSYLNLSSFVTPDWVYAPLAVVSSWCLVLGCIFTFREWLNHESKVIKYIVDGSYFIYLVHLPIIIVLQILLYKLPLSWAIKFPLNTLLSLFLSLLVYHFAVRNRFTDYFLKGEYKKMFSSSNPS